MAERRRLRPRGFDDLGLKRALGDRMLPALVAAMAFLAALSIAGAIAAASLGRHWQEGATAALTVQVPRRDADAGRVERVLAALRGTPGIAEAHALDDRELADLLRPWLGTDQQSLALPIPAVIEVRLTGTGPDLAALAGRLESAAPGVLVQSHGLWVDRLTTLARSLQACAALVLLVVAAVAAAVVTVATRTGLVARRDAIEIIHGLGATDGYIAGRFAGRASRLAGIGGAVGAAIALPFLIALATIAAPFLNGTTEAATVSADPPAAALAASFDVIASVPAAVWLAAPALPLFAWAIGYATAQLTVRRWLRRLP
ncbi:MAG TPA: cell division protein FtsX [Acetobacteraceae bacterium]|jgi:cell division transport system permease protein|nr:cell division protein FtsX [Acetobacteraceae bacterium]